MRETCHRCGGDLPDFEAAGEGRSPFCPHCGAPQLLLADYTESISTASESPDGSSTGMLPPPRPNRIDWPIALSSALLVAAVASVLGVVAARLPGLSLIVSVWVVSASLTALAIYQRRRPLAAMNAGVGARIGLLVGTVLVFFLAATLSVGLCIGRFGLNAMAQIDVEMARALKAQLDQLALSRPIPPDVVVLVSSLQFRAAMMLCYFSLVLFAILLISIFGGAVGGLLRTRRFTGKA